MKRWYDTFEAAREAARGSGYYFWRVQRMVRVRRGWTHWSLERRPVGNPRWYVWNELPKSLLTTKYECKKEMK